MSDLAARLREVIEERLKVAREAADGDSGRWFAGDGWNVYRAEDETPYDDHEENRLVVYGNIKPQSEHIALCDPADAILAGEWALGVLERHRAVPLLGRSWCRGCDEVVSASATRGDRDEPPPWPCGEIRAIAKRYGIEVE